jgi:hypothetical protein
MTLLASSVTCVGTVTAQPAPLVLLRWITLARLVQFTVTSLFAQRTVVSENTANLCAYASNHTCLGSVIFKGESSLDVSNPLQNNASKVLHVFTPVVGNFKAREVVRQ